MSGNNIAPQQISLTLAEGEWSVVLSALYEAALPMKLTAPVANKVQTGIANARAAHQAQPQEGTS
jgi:hypothetical protein